MRANMKPMHIIRNRNDQQEWLQKPGYKIDLHSHTRFSSKPTNYLTKKLGIGECTTDPEDAYRIAMDMGLSMYTCTDHDTIDGNLLLRSKGYQVPISVEVTASFPHNNHKKRCKIHVLTYELNPERAEAIFKDIGKLRHNIYDLIHYYDQHDILYMAAHPFYSVNDRITVDIFEQILLLFDHFEINGSKGETTNKGLQFVIQNLTPGMLEQLADKHSRIISAPKTDCHRKQCSKAGQDAHIKRYIGRSFTYNPDAVSIRDLFETHSSKNIAVVRNSLPENLNFVLYCVGIEHKVKNNIELEKAISQDKRLSAVFSMLTSKQLPAPTIIANLSCLLKRFVSKEENSLGKLEQDEPLSFLLQSIQKIPFNEFKTAENKSISKQFFQLMQKSIDDAVLSFINQKTHTPVRTILFNPCRTLGTIIDLEKLILPYGISVRVFNETRSFTKNVTKSLYPNGSTRTIHVAHFFDTFHEINGPARFAQQLAVLSSTSEIDYKILTSGNQTSQFGEHVFPANMSFTPELYPDQKLRIPSLVDVINHCYKEHYTHFHAATPGPLGLMALLAAKRLFKVPFFVTHHTDFAKYLGSYTQDIHIEEMVWELLKQFYSQADIVFVLSCDSKNDLIHHGIDKNKIRLFKRGIDTKRFHPPNAKRSTEDFTLITSCRLAKDKGLEYLIPAIKKLLGKRKDICWKFIGDGPYKETFQHELSGYNVLFTGFLTGETYVKTLQDADLFVFPSIADTFGQTPMEAQACGVPVIVTNRGGPKDNVLDGETGLIVEGKSSSALLEGIESVLDKDLLQQMGLKARAYVAERSFENAFQELCKHYTL